MISHIVGSSTVAEVVSSRPISILDILVLCCCFGTSFDFVILSANDTADLVMGPVIKADLPQPYHSSLEKLICFCTSSVAQRVDVFKKERFVR